MVHFDCYIYGTSRSQKVGEGEVLGSSYGVGKSQRGRAIFMWGVDPLRHQILFEGTTRK